MTTTLTQSPTQTGTRIAIGISVVSLLLSGLSLLINVTEEADHDQIEQRLACLELPGPNDCGPER